MIVIEALKKVYRKYEGDADYPDFADDDMQLYFDHLKDAIEEWVEKFPNFRESFAELVDASDGTKTTSTGVSSYSAPTNFVAPAGFVYVGSQRYEYASPQRAKVFLDENSLAEYFTVTGYPGAYKIVINPAPSGGQTINYPYWKKITAPAGENSVLEISRPYYCVFYILYHLYLDDPNNKDLAQEYREKMQEQERLERVALARTPTGTPNRTNDMGYIRFGAGFGQKGSGADE